MHRPPKIGPSAIGNLRTSECMVTPMVRLFVGSTFAIRPMVAGKEIADQARKKIAPIKTTMRHLIRI